MQVFGPGEVDKMVDIAVMGINMDAKLDDFENADFAYAPPFSTAIHPFVQAVYVLMNKIDGSIVSMTPAEYAAGAAEGYRVVDVAPARSKVLQKMKNCCSYARKARELISSRTVCVTMDIPIQWCWKALHSSMM